VNAASSAFKDWGKTSVLTRQRYMFDYLRLLKENHSALAKLITLENGKTHIDAMGDVQRGIEVVEHTLSFASLMMGETSANLAEDVDTYSYRTPLGVCAGIAPFNFPVMIPLWMFPVGITCGNTYIMKPSEVVPGASNLMMELLEKTGIPKGVVNIVHGGAPTVDLILEEPAIRSVSFVGSNRAGEYIYNKGSVNGKRVQSNMGAKNHGIVLPDANKEDTLNQLVGAAFGAGGQRCMALPVVVFVGEAGEWIKDLVPLAKQLVVSAGSDPKSQVGPLITKKHTQYVLNHIQKAKEAGASILLDGSTFKSKEFPNGNFVGPTIIDNVTTEMDCYKQEIFGPVMCTIRCETFDEAINLINR
jgi:malonate-semialdehyde dehydrogenase (acetylating)/methylmalonate-semialdehyde dehydrogenase